LDSRTAERRNEMGKYRDKVKVKEEVKVKEKLAPEKKEPKDPIKSFLRKAGYKKADILKTVDRGDHWILITVDAQKHRIEK